MARSWDAVLNSLSTSTLSVVLFSLAAPVITFIVTLVVVSKRNPEQDLIAHLRESIIPTVIGFAVPLTLILCVLGWKTIATIYDDHQSLVATVERLQNAPKQLPCPTCPICPTTKACAGGDANARTARRAIQEQLAKLMNEGIMLRSRWNNVMGQPEENQRAVARDIPYWHAQIENYIRTLPRSDVYLVRLNSAHRSDLGYPIGMNMNVGGNWDILLVDLVSLKELMDDPEFGKP
jgi:hypothetical protein